MRTRRKFCAAAALLAMVAVSASAAVARQLVGETERKGLWVDEGLRLQLDLPASWSLVPEIKRTVPDAVAGGVADEGVWSVIIPERIRPSSLEAYADLVLEASAMRIDALLVEQRQETHFADREAYRVSYSGKVNDVDVAFRSLVFANADHMFQILCWGVDSEDLESTCGQFEKSVTVLPGEVTGETLVEVVPPDASGAGWTLRDGLVRHYGAGVEVRPEHPWRPLVGPELENFAPDAAVGLMHRRLGIYLYLISERVPESARIAYEDWIDSLIAQDAEPGPVVSGRLLDREIEIGLTFGEESGAKLTYLNGRQRDGDVYRRIGGVFQTPEAAEASAWLTTALEGVASFAKLDTQVVEDEGLGVAVGAEFSLREGRYRDFSERFTWRDPGGCWLMSAPTGEARLLEGELVFDNPCAGLSATAWIEESDGVEAETLLLELAEFTGAEGALAEAREDLSRSSARVDGADAVWSTVYAAGADGELPLAQYQGVLAWKDRHIRIEGTGFSEYLRAGRGRLDELFDFLQLQSPSKAEFAQGRYQDHRLGFSVQGPADWVFADLTPPEVRSIGSLMQWQARDRSLLALGLWAQTGAPEALLRRMVDQFTNQPDVFPDPPIEEQTTVAGNPATHLRWVGEVMIAEAMLIRRDRRAYLLYSLRMGGGSASWWSDFVASFELLRD